MSGLCRCGAVTWDTEPVDLGHGPEQVCRPCAEGFWHRHHLMRQETERRLAAQLGVHKVLIIDGLRALVAENDGDLTELVFI